MVRSATGDVAVDRFLPSALRRSCEVHFFDSKLRAEPTAQGRVGRRNWFALRWRGSHGLAVWTVPFFDVAAAGEFRRGRAEKLAGRRATISFVVERGPERPCRSVCSLRPRRTNVVAARQSERSAGSCLERIRKQRDGGGNGR